MYLQTGLFLVLLARCTCLTGFSQGEIMATPLPGCSIDNSPSASRMTYMFRLSRRVFTPGLRINIYPRLTSTRTVS